MHSKIPRMVNIPLNALTIQKYMKISKLQREDEWECTTIGEVEVWNK